MESNKIEKILENAYSEMQRRYRDILDISYKIREKKDNLKEMMYLIDLRGQVIVQINYIQKTLEPVFYILKTKANIEMDNIYSGNSRIRDLKENIKRLIMAVTDIDKEISEHIMNTQKELKQEILKIKNSKKINKSYYNPKKITKNLVDSRK